MHFRYLQDSILDCENFLNKQPNCKNLFDKIMYFYNEKRNLHSQKAFIIHCFETALRSTLATKTADLFNSTNDSWYKNPTNNKSAEKILKIANKNKRRFKITKDFANTFELFDILTFGDLIDIVKILWDDIHGIFTEPKSYKNEKLPKYGSKSHLISKIDTIRQARNEIYHNKPTNVKFVKESEILLLRMGYNLKEAISQSQNNLIPLNFNYN